MCATTSQSAHGLQTRAPVVVRRVEEGEAHSRAGPATCHPGVAIVRAESASPPSTVDAETARPAPSPAIAADATGAIGAIGAIGAGGAGGELAGPKRDGSSGERLTRARAIYETTPK